VPGGERGVGLRNERDRFESGDDGLGVCGKMQVNGFSFSVVFVFVFDFSFVFDVFEYEGEYGGEYEGDIDMLASVALSEGPGLEKETCLFLSLFEGPSRDSQGLQSLQKAANAAFFSVGMSDCFAT
jgi:hypothetical protein